MGRRRTEITFETYEVLSVRQPGALSQLWCPACGCQVGAISLVDASRAGLTSEALREQEADGRLHLFETPIGVQFICLNSLIQPEKERPLKE